jgi:hypothetical protein
MDENAALTKMQHGRTLVQPAWTYSQHGLGLELGLELGHVL